MCAAAGIEALNCTSSANATVPRSRQECLPALVNCSSFAASQKLGRTDAKDHHRKQEISFEGAANREAWPGLEENRCKHEGGADCADYSGNIPEPQGHAQNHKQEEQWHRRAEYSPRENRDQTPCNRCAVCRAQG
jgi:hypothetical protein